MTRKTSFVSILILVISSILSAQNILNVEIGPTWPKALRESEKKVAWNVSVEYGKVFDKIIGIGVDFDFSWNVFSSDSVVITTSDTVNMQLEANKIFMFPISGFLMIDPIPAYKLHPVIKGQVGFNMMAKSYEEVDTSGDVIKSKKNGFYIGIIGKASADAVLDLGEHAAVFAGFEFQWGKLSHRRTDTNSKIEYKDYFEFYGPGIRMGLSFLF